MLDEKKIQDTRKRVAEYLREGILLKKRDAKFVDFFLSNARNSLETAQLLFEVSIKPDLQKTLGVAPFNGFLWVINASYYSMFYTARALIEKEGTSIKSTQSIHQVTFDVLVHNFYLTEKLQKKLIEDFAEALDESSQLLGKEKAKTLIEDYFYEKEKRATFTYELGVVALQNKAQTSLDRAKRFNEAIRTIVGR